uniref:Uncharacterized protein n=1 Tax=Triticum urartu TaxID=4572 RepID=A0A8R7PFU8_TRIUA
MSSVLPSVSEGIRCITCVGEKNSAPAGSKKSRSDRTPRTTAVSRSRSSFLSSASGSRSTAACTDTAKEFRPLHDASSRDGRRMKCSDGVSYTVFAVRYTTAAASSGRARNELVRG